jgi:hypothetical protein
MTLERTVSSSGRRRSARLRRRDVKRSSGFAPDLNRPKTRPLVRPSLVQFCRGGRILRAPRRWSDEAACLRTVGVEPELETPQQYSAAGGYFHFFELDTASPIVNRPASGIRAQKEFAYSSRPAPTARKSQPIKICDWSDMFARRFGYETVSKPRRVRRSGLRNRLDRISRRLSARRPAPASSRRRACRRSASSACCG